MKPRILWIGLCSFEEQLRSRFDLVTASGARESDLRLEGCNVSARALIGRMGKPPDLVVSTDGDLGLVVDAEDIDVPSVALIFDPHLHSWTRPYGRIFDHFVSTQHSCVTEMSPLVDGLSMWLPYWVQGVDGPNGRPIPLADRDIDVAFVGCRGKPNQAARDAFLDKIQTGLGGRYRVHIGPGQWREIYDRSRIVINAPVSNDLNMRVFEATVCGAVLISPGGVDGMTRFFDPGRDFISYRALDAEDALHRIRETLDRLDKVQPVARRAFTKTSSLHLENHRVDTLCRMLGRMIRHKVSRSSQEDRAFRSAWGLIVLALEVPIVRAESWKDWFEARLRLAREKLESIADASDRLKQETGFLLGIIHHLQGHPAESIRCFEAAARGPRLEQIAGYGESRMWRLLGDAAKANRCYPRGLRAASLPGDVRPYWDLLLNALQFEVKNYVVPVQGAEGFTVMRGRSREKELVLTNLAYA